MVRMVARRWRLRREADVWPSKPINSREHAPNHKGGPTWAQLWVR
jgi:hypothetical protein